jgi:UDP-N-acetylmuramate dehydrogenase
VTATLHEILETNAPLPTWFGIGGRADTLARPRTSEELRDLLVMFAGQPIRILGDGANLLVDDDGVGGLVVSLDAFDQIEYTSHDEAPGRRQPVTVHAGAGVRLPKLIVETVRRGLAGLETLAGIPASIGGAVFMNAGGAFGQIADVVESVHAVTRLGDELVIPHDQICFDYRHSGLGWLVITGAELHLTHLPEAEHGALRQKLKDVMAYKKDSQPLAEDSAGCVFRNPTVSGTRVSAGMLIDQSGCKGLHVGGARVSEVHANFFVAEDGCRAADIIALMDEVQRRVAETCGVQLQPEVVVWRRGEDR